jgi:hypothetical protein
MSANMSTEPTMEEENIFSGLKKKKKAKKVEEEPSPAPTPTGDDDAAAEEGGDMFADLKKKWVSRPFTAHGRGPGPVRSSL